MTTATLTPERTGTAPAAKEHIVRTPGTCLGKPRIAGTRIKVSAVYEWHERLGRSAAQIVLDYPHLTLADVYAALAYAHDHREEIEAELENGRLAVAEFMAKQPSLFQKIAEKRPDVAELSNAAATAYVESGACPPEDVATLRDTLERRDRNADLPALTAVLARK